MNPAVANGSSGNSRRMNFTLPVSTYLDLRSFQGPSWKAAQCGQVIEAYSTMVIGALAAPWTMSGSGPGAISASSGMIVGAESEASGLAAAVGAAACGLAGAAGE